MLKTPQFTNDDQEDEVPRVAGVPGISGSLIYAVVLYLVSDCELVVDVVVVFVVIDGDEDDDEALFAIKPALLVDCCCK